MLGADPNSWRIVGAALRAASSTLAPTVRQVLGGALLVGEVQRVREERVNIALALLLLIGLLLAQAVDGLDAVLDGAQAIINVVSSAQRYARMGSSSSYGRCFLRNALN